MPSSLYVNNTKLSKAGDPILWSVAHYQAVACWPVGCMSAWQVCTYAHKQPPHTSIVASVVGVCGPMRERSHHGKRRGSLQPHLHESSRPHSHEQWMCVCAHVCACVYPLQNHPFFPLPPALGCKSLGNSALKVQYR